MPAKRERSAGVIVYREDSEEADTRKFLLLDHGHFWDFPKGHVKKREDDPTAALRELEEETGVDDAQLITGFSHTIEYFFRDRVKGLIHKQVIFFLARTKRRRITISEEHVGHAFLPLDEAIERVTYPSSKNLLRLAGEFLKSHPVV